MLAFRLFCGFVLFSVSLELPAQMDLFLSGLVSSTSLHWLWFFFFGLFIIFFFINYCLFWWPKFRCQLLAAAANLKLYTLRSNLFGVSFSLSLGTRFHRTGAKSGK